MQFTPQLKSGAMTAEIISEISKLLGEPVLRYQALSGGDISSVYLTQTSTQQLVLKIQSGQHASKMLQAEHLGLAEIGATRSIAVPRVLEQIDLGNQSVLLMDFIESRPSKTVDHTQLGLQLAELHQHTSDSFGWDHDNFIGRLPQSNQANQDWTSFYVNQRLLPQISLAESHNLLSKKEIPSSKKLLDRCRTLFPKQVTSSLLHGDLWSGNYLIATNGTPYLIDPSVYYGHGEVDLAMSRLFDGFGPAFYDAYYSIIPAVAGWEERVDMYQLYYLLVHLNMFGASYRKSVLRILQD